MKKHLPIIVSKTIKHKEQRYDTAGDYITNKDGIDVYNISELKKGWRAELAVLIHEMVEYQLCKEKGIKEEEISKFDTQDVEPKYEDDPGMSPKAPYHKEHLTATKIEKYVIKTLGLDFKEYDEDFSKLKY